jgi:hypothetical protein
MVDNSDADASGKWVNKWKAPPWLKPGTKVRVARGRKFPIGITGQCLAILKTGHGVEAAVAFDPTDLRCSDGSLISAPGLVDSREIGILNLEPC